MKNTTPLKGLIAAAYTPLHEDGKLNLDQVGPLVDRLIAEQVDGLYVCGTTGEGMSLTGAERRAVAEAFVSAAAARVPVVVQVGHNSLAEARELAAHAQDIGADAFSSTCPSYFKVGSVDVLIACMAEVAAGAPELPFYFYHIPALTGADCDMIEFLSRAGERIPNLAGVKYTDTKLHEYQQCMRVVRGGGGRASAVANRPHIVPRVTARSDDGECAPQDDPSPAGDDRYAILWGCDEMLLPALSVGAKAAVGSTYNIAAALYKRLLAAFQRGDIDEARRLQSLSQQMIRTIAAYPFHSAMKEVLAMLGLDCGPCRLPQPSLSAEDAVSLRTRLESIGFFQWCRATAAGRDENRHGPEVDPNVAKTW